MFAFGQRSKEDNEWLNGGYTGEIEASIEALHTQIAEKEIARIAALKAQAKPEEKTMFPQENEAQIPAMPQVEVKLPDEPKREIDDYQRRGLSLSKNPGVVQDKIVKIQEQIRDILKAAKIEGKQLVWS